MSSKLDPNNPTDVESIESLTGKQSLTVGQIVRNERTRGGDWILMYYVTIGRDADLRPGERRNVPATCFSSLQLMAVSFPPDDDGARLCVHEPTCMSSRVSFTGLFSGVSLEEAVHGTCGRLNPWCIASVKELQSWHLHENVTDYFLNMKSETDTRWKH